MPSEAPDNPNPNVLKTADMLTSQDRRNVYGHPLDDFQCTADIWTALLRRQGLLVEGKSLSPEMAQILMMALKTTRLAVTDGQHRDSGVDVAGYARTIEMTIDERARRKAEDTE